jgi:hypothetical protein
VASPALVRTGFASTTVERVVAGGKTVEVTRVKIDAGRRVLAK